MNTDSRRFQPEPAKRTHLHRCPTPPAWASNAAAAACGSRWTTIRATSCWQPGERFVGDIAPARAGVGAASPRASPSRARSRPPLPVRRSRRAASPWRLLAPRDVPGLTRGPARRTIDRFSLEGRRIDTWQRHTSSPPRAPRAAAAAASSPAGIRSDLAAQVIDALVGAQRHRPGGGGGRDPRLRQPGRRAGHQRGAQRGAGVEAARIGAGHLGRPAVRLLAAGAALRGAGGDVRQHGRGDRRRRREHDARADVHAQRAAGARPAWAAT